MLYIIGFKWWCAKLKIQSSYIFLQNNYKNKPEDIKVEKIENENIAGKIVIKIDKLVSQYITECFPNISMNKEETNRPFKIEYSCVFSYGKYENTVRFVINNVADVTYLDIFVDGKSKAQAINCMESIQDKLLNSGMREYYIDIVSYDSVSEHYCNKIYPKLNELERNLRKLMFNIYIVYFGKEYYANIDEETQRKIKQLIKEDKSTDKRSKIKQDFNAKNNEEVEEVKRLQRFFYSLEYSDIQKLLFTYKWTGFDENEKKKFLSNIDLSQMSDEELRNAFLQFTPKSDWERFFSNKIAMIDIISVIDSIRQYRNNVAHCKFFYKNDYYECKKLINRLNKAIIKAIELTEKNDFTKKNMETISNGLKTALSAFSFNMEAYVQSSSEYAINNISASLGYFASRLGEILKSTNNT